MRNSEIPIHSAEIGNAENALRLGVATGIEEILPDVKQYYLERAKQYVPFDIPIVIR